MPRLRSNNCADRDSSGAGGGADETTALSVADDARAAGGGTATAVAGAATREWSDAYMKAKPTARPDRPTATRVLRTEV